MGLDKIRERQRRVTLRTEGCDDLLAAEPKPGRTGSDQVRPQLTFLAVQARRSGLQSLPYSAILDQST